uniref:Secreted protein n=1 Tax=Aegilops tauschii subsp. strangulata TaxID=200361 RepID=A0A453GMV5_AEGTS
MSYVDIILFFVLLLSSHWNNAFLSIYKVQPCGSGHDAKDTDGLGLHTMQVYMDQQNGLIARWTYRHEMSREKMIGLSRRNMH